MFKLEVMATILQVGQIKPNDAIVVELPRPPHQVLERV